MQPVGPSQPVASNNSTSNTYENVIKTVLELFFKLRGVYAGHQKTKAAAFYSQVVANIQIPSISPQALPMSVLSRFSGNTSQPQQPSGDSDDDTRI